MLDICPKCKKNFDSYSKWGTKKFCSRSCANTRSVTLEHKLKTSQTLRAKPIKNQFGYWNAKIIPEGPYSKIYLCTCKYSERKFYSNTPKRIHPDLKDTKNQYTYSCQFRFSISDFPLWFTEASNLIKQHGWYSTPGSKKGILNTNGISRDHLYSITDGWINNIPPKIIRHPANCALIPHSQNQSKHKKSSISLEELYNRIEQFEKLYS